MEYYVQHLSEELAALGHEVTVFTSTNRNTPSVYTKNGVTIQTHRIMSKIYNIPIAPNLFTQLLATEKPDIIHTHQYPVYFSDTAAAACWIKKIPIIIQVHVISDAKSVISGFISELYYRSLGLRTLQIADSVVVPSVAYKYKVSKLHINLSKIKVIPYGINIKNFQGSSNSSFKAKNGYLSSKVILSVGRLNYQKGFQYLIQAMPELTKKVQNLKLIIVGEGEQLLYLVKLAKNLGVQDSVIFMGALSQTEMPSIYQACDIFVLPSLFESFGISLIEAQAAGKPVVATRTGGVPEALVESKTGFLVEPGDPKQLEVAILRLLTNEDLASAMGNEGRRFVKSKYDIRTSLDNMVELYKETVA
jgi:Glycosyltransferase